MLPLTKKHKFHIPNGLAALAALLLLVSSLASMGGSTPSASEHSQRYAATEEASETTGRVQVLTSSKAKKNNGFKMSLFLFRNK